MKMKFWLAAIAAAALASQAAIAQAPAGATGQCKDGTYSTAAKKEGACRGHQGVQAWFTPLAAPGGTATPAAKPAAGTTAKGASPALAPAAKTKPTPPTPAAASTPATAPTPAQAPTPAASPRNTASSSPRMGPAAEAASRPQAAGGGPGMVWLNTPTKVYHCPGGDFYGKTKEGKYMSEADAKAMGARPDHNKPCTR